MSRNPTNNRNDSPRFAGMYPHPKLEAALDECGQDLTFRSVGWPTWGLLYQLVQAAWDPTCERLQAVVEVGTDQGYTTVVLAQALEDMNATGGVVGLDTRQEAVDATKSFLLQCGLGLRADVFRCDASQPAWISEVWETLKRKETQVPFVFVDFSKGYDENIVVLRGAAEVLSEGGMIVVDNAWCKGVKQAVDEIASSDEWSVLRLFNSSWGFWPQRERGGTPGMAVLQRRF